ncbi:hypothetical protein Tcan_15597 [Toxocara canis]|uniref:Uncharacterized protein n=1 Tax=Toxocara canis TaxID=6265 RepID=A0A0B2VB55_TOXCA|nr:hypothetical protein Tcan_15597 [Toxocara canis]
MKASTCFFLTLALMQLGVAFSYRTEDQRARMKRQSYYYNYPGYGYGMGSYFYGTIGGGYNNNYGGTNIDKRELNPRQREERGVGWGEGTEAPQSNGTPLVASAEEYLRHSGGCVASEENLRVIAAQIDDRIDLSFLFKSRLWEDSGSPNGKLTGLEPRRADLTIASMKANEQDVHLAANKQFVYTLVNLGIPARPREFSLSGSYGCGSLM